MRLIHFLGRSRMRQLKVVIALLSHTEAHVHTLKTHN